MAEWLKAQSISLWSLKGLPTVPSGAPLATVGSCPPHPVSASRWLCGFVHLGPRIHTRLSLPVWILPIFSLRSSLNFNRESSLLPLSSLKCCPKPVAFTEFYFMRAEWCGGGEQRPQEWTVCPDRTPYQWCNPGHGGVSPQTLAVASVECRHQHLPYRVVRRIETVGHDRSNLAGAAVPFKALSVVSAA